MASMFLTRRVAEAAIISLVCVFVHRDPGVLMAQEANPADALRTVFENVGRQTGGFIPGMFTELSPEQLAKLESVVVSPREEAAFGLKVLKDYESGLAAKNQSLLRTGVDVAYIHSLVDRIRPQMKNRRRYGKLDIAVLQTSEIDAYSVPGGHLIFTTGLLADCESEAALIGVAAHELSHLDHGHQLLPLKQQKSVGDMRNWESGMLWVSTLARPMRPEFETRADEDAARWTLAAGYDARQLAHLLERWEVRLNGNQPWTQVIPDFAKTHPAAGRRAERVLSIYDAEKPAGKELIVGVESLKNRKANKQ